MAYTIGQLVQHSTFGLGKIIKVESDKILVFFKDLPTESGSNPKKFPVNTTNLGMAPNQSDPWLDSLDMEIAASGKPRQYLTHDAAVAKFLRRFPLGFADPKFLNDERNYKWDGHETWKQLLNEKEFRRLIAAEDYAEVKKLTLQVESNLNLLSTFEKIALRDGLKSAEVTRDFSLGLYDLIHGEDALEPRFERFVGVLGTLPQRQTSTVKWPVQTLFLFLAFPEKYLFLKPTPTQEAAKRRGFELNYRPQPNWLTYSSLLKFGELLMNDLAPMGCRDMIDVQSFMWVTRED